MKNAFRSLRQEMHAIVVEAHRAGRPIGAELIWGLLTRDVSLRRVTSELTWMQRGDQVRAQPAPKGMFEGGHKHNVYTPGPAAVPAARGGRYFDEFLGAMEALRLQAARAQARKWLREGKVAA